MVLFLASLPQDKYEIVTQIFEKYESCDVKDQVLSCNQRAVTRISKLDCKGGYFKPLRGMDCVTRKELLQQVCDGDASFNDLSSSCKYAKNMRDIQLSFMRYVDLQSWEVALATYPNFTKKEHLEPFMSLAFRKETIPPSFASYCQLAKQSLIACDSSNSTSEVHTVTVGKATALLLNQDIRQIVTDQLLTVMRNHGA